jgi:hypothetical protein
MKLTYGLVMVVLTNLVACSSNEANGAASRGADEALAEPTCYVDLKLSDVEYTGGACSGSSQSSTVSALGPDSWDDTRITVTIALNKPPAVGMLDVSDMTIQQPKDDGTTSSWRAPLDACTFEAIGSNVDSDMGWTYFRIDVACTSPATPIDDAALGPLELGQFSIVTFFTN